MTVHDGSKKTMKQSSNKRRWNWWWMLQHSLLHLILFGVASLIFTKTMSFPSHVTLLASSYCTLQFIKNPSRKKSLHYRRRFIVWPLLKRTVNRLLGKSNCDLHRLKQSIIRTELNCVSLTYSVLSTRLTGISCWLKINRLILLYALPLRHIYVKPCRGISRDQKKKTGFILQPIYTIHQLSLLLLAKRSISEDCDTH